MTAELFDSRGPEANNRRAGEFECQIEDMSRTLGWTPICHNVDVKINPKGRKQSRGIDLLSAFENPQSGEKDGVLSESKVHKDQITLAPLQKELQTLHDKMGEFSRRQAFAKHEDIREHLSGLRWGLLTHRTTPWDPKKSERALRSVRLKGLHKVAYVTTMIFGGPDVLEALADCVTLRVDDKPLNPQTFYWPAHEYGEGVWASCCPPHQLGEGMLAYKTKDGRTVLWLRDTLKSRDMSLIKDIVFHWRIDPDVVVFSELQRDDWALLTDTWRVAAKDTRERRFGRLPDPKYVYARGLTYTGLHNFDDAWPIRTQAA